MATSITDNRASQISVNTGDTKRKVMIAVVLVMVMGMMWAKVLLADKIGPGEASASTVADQEGESSDGSSKVKIEYTKLAVVAGRHDLLMNDMFGIKEWCGVEPAVEIVEPAAVEETKRVEGDPLSQEELDAIVENVKVEMILVGDNGKETEVFINDKIMRVGSKFKIENASGTYLLEITKLSKNEVVVGCEGIVSSISMSKKNGISNN